MTFLAPRHQFPHGLVSFCSNDTEHGVAYVFTILPPAALNKFSQLTPWVQVVVMAFTSLNVLGVAYFFKETVRVLTQRKDGDNRPE